ncbi:TMEM43 family protein [Candidatus Halobeggiatoa sp. HSG11]|nr:TMEM43 family protein [Candidatus Halobeggiatoa sp. HSG11]
MSYTEVTTESWWSRIKNSFGNILLGLILFLVAFPLLFWNEGRAVYRAQTLEEGISIVTSIEAEQIDRNNEGKLVHLIGQTESNETLSDERFGIVQDNIIKLQRIVQMYQWQENRHSETEEKLGGGTETVTTYTYTKDWNSRISDSSNFKQSKVHQNPSSMPFNSGTFKVKEVTIGAFYLSPSLINRINNYQKLPITKATFEQIPEGFRDGLQIYNNSYYMGEDPAQPQIGDLKIRFEVVLPDTVSIIAKQFGSTFDSYITQVGGEIELFEYGRASAENMFKHEQEFNVMLTWILRFVGFIVMFIGLNLIFGVLRTLAAVVPFLANIVGFIGSLVNFIIAATLSLITIAIAWIFYRPLLGIALLIVAGGLLYFLKFAYKPQEEILPITEIVE